MLGTCEERKKKMWFKTRTCEDRWRKRKYE